MVENSFCYPEIMALFLHGFLKSAHTFVNESFINALKPTGVLFFVVVLFLLGFCLLAGWFLLCFYATSFLSVSKMLHRAHAAY